MLPDVGATELMIIAAVALIVVGPKDLPVLMRKVGQFMARMRGMAAEFRASFDEMARQSELDELRKEVQALRSNQFMSDTQAAVSAHTAGVDDVFHEIEHDLRASSEPEVYPDPWSVPAIDGDPSPEAPPKPKRKRAAKPSAAGTADVTPAPKAKPKRPRIAKAPTAPKVEL